MLNVQRTSSFQTSRLSWMNATLCYRTFLRLFRLSSTKLRTCGRYTILAERRWASKTFYKYLSPYDMLTELMTGPIPCCRPDMAEHRILRAMEDHHFHFLKSRFLAMEGLHAVPFCGVIPNMFLDYLDCVTRRLPCLSSQVGMGRTTHVLKRIRFLLTKFLVQFFLS